MERLPYIDEHSLHMEATCEQVWPALLAMLRNDLGGRESASFTRLLGTVPGGLQGDWRGTPAPGDSLPGFEVSEILPLRRLALRGHHRFSRYALVFELDPDDQADTSGCTLRAQSWAEFPGATGRAYRALVIGSHGHRLVVRRLLRQVARRV
jgi:hypothetical protein